MIPGTKATAAAGNRAPGTQGLRQWGEGKKDPSVTSCFREQQHIPGEDGKRLSHKGGLLIGACSA